MNKWKKIWENRQDTLGNIDKKDYREIFAKLAKIDGYDLNGGATAESLIKQYETLKATLNLSAEQNIFEVGCGAGAQLYLFAHDGFEVGGLDYSSTLINIAKKILPDKTELICAEADELSTDKKFDAVFSNGVFIYFDDFTYAERALEKMFKKSRRAVAVLDIYDKELEEIHMNHRRQTIENYDERYKDLPKLFYPRSFFKEFADHHNLSIRFEKNELENYGNAPFTYHCFMERKN